MKAISYLTAPLVILALFVLGCGQATPTASSGNEVVTKIDAPTVPSTDEVGSQLTAEAVGNPNGNCCPDNFFLALSLGNPSDINGDSAVCVKGSPGGPITIDNNVAGECEPVGGCIPPCDPL
ncbi:MAG: hypothetical protein IH914_04885 [candidate division Zixibacteria bacterium]|nr:hypothetical protein [candidate division Zixibacteria bacterium]